MKFNLDEFTTYQVLLSLHEFSILAWPQFHMLILDQRIELSYLSFTLTIPTPA